MRPVVALGRIVSILCFVVVASAPPADAAPRFREFSVPDGTQPQAITAGPNGNLWFSAGPFDDGHFGRITPGGAVKIIPCPECETPAGDITAGPDGNLWFLHYSYVGRLTTQGEITLFRVSAPFDDLHSIVAGPDGNVWFTAHNPFYAVGAIGRVTPDGAITEFPIDQGDMDMAEGVAAGPDGNLWFTQPFLGQIGRMTPQGAFLTPVVIPSPDADPRDIALGPDGALWFTEINANRIGRIVPGGVVTEFQIPMTDALPRSIVAGPDEAMWFLEKDSPGAGRIARISMTGLIRESPPVQGVINDLAAGGDGNIWLTLYQPEAIARLSLS